MKKVKVILFVVIFLLLRVTVEAKINPEKYDNNRGESYRVSKEERHKLLDNGKLFIWEKDEGDEKAKGEYILLKDIKDEKGNKLDIKKYIDIYSIDFDGDGINELCIIPSKRPLSDENEKSSEEWFYVGNAYRATIFKKSGQEYKPYKVASIKGEYSHILDVRDYNGDGLPDMLLGCSSGGSTYKNITELFYFDKKDKTLKTQVFSHSVELYNFMKDGVYELVVFAPDPVSTRSSHAAWAYWADIFVWDGNKYVIENEKYPEYYDNNYIPYTIQRMIDCASLDSAVRDRVPLIKRAWGIVLKAGMYGTIDDKGAKSENVKGLTCIDKGDKENALKHFKKAVSLSPQDPEFVNNLGYVYELSGEYEKAIDCYFTTLARDAERAVAWYNLGCCKAMTGKKEEGVLCFYNYIRFAPGEAKAKEAIKDLSKNAKSKEVREAAKEAYENYSVKEN